MTVRKERRKERVLGGRQKNNVGWGRRRRRRKEWDWKRYRGGRVGFSHGRKTGV